MDKILSSLKVGDKGKYTSVRVMLGLLFSCSGNGFWTDRFFLVHYHSGDSPGGSGTPNCRVFVSFSFSFHSNAIM